MRRRGAAAASVRLTGRIHLTGGGQMNLGRVSAWLAKHCPIEIVSHDGARISIGDHTFINLRSSISAHKQVKIGHHCLLGHYTHIYDNNEHGVDHRDVVPPSAPVTIGDDVWNRVWVNHPFPAFPSATRRCRCRQRGNQRYSANCLAVGNPARVVRQLGQSRSESRP